MGAFRVVGQQVCVEDGLHLFDRFEPGLSALDTEVFVEKCAVEPLHDVTWAP